MSTSIRDLLTAATDELDAARTRQARQRAGVSAGVEALTTISAAAQILSWLRRDGVQADPYGIREHAVTALATATRHVATASRGLPDSRAALLLGAAGDVIGTLQHDLGREDRWALALAVADTVRRASTLYKSAGPSAPNRHVDWSRRAAVILAHLGAEHPPEPRHLTVQDRPVPDPVVGRATTALATAAQAVDNVTRLVQRSSGPLPLYQLKAITALAETAVRYLTAVAATAAPNSDDAWDRVPRTWTRVRHDIGVFHDGQLVRRNGSDHLLAWAALGHDAIARALGPADQITASTVAALTTTDKTHLIEIANQLPTIATALRAQLADVDGRAFARITDLPHQERRITEQIRGLPVIANGPDFATAHATLRSAELLSTRLASELPGRIAVATSQPHLATHYAAITADHGPIQRAAPARHPRPEQGVDSGLRHRSSPPPGR
ncbi:MAG TPA: hypothetical protein VGL39_01560 [Jatrophihabitantaceae bacterium]|jgi:hypothetical protein